MDKLFGTITLNPPKAELRPNDYLDDEGFICCGPCRTRREADVDLKDCGGIQRIKCLCDCEREKREKEDAALEAQQRDMRKKELEKECFKQQELIDWAFGVDDRRDGKASDLCRDYVGRWDEMRKINAGVLFYGTKGTGKTFYACCIANALIQAGVRVHFTSIPEILAQKQKGWDFDIDDVNNCDLLIIDDLGKERDTSYAQEQLYHIANLRYQTRKPMIVTTNLSLDEIADMKFGTYGATYDRIIEMCSIPVYMGGDSRRTGILAEKQQKAKTALGY